MKKAKRYEIKEEISFRGKGKKGEKGKKEGRKKKERYKEMLQFQMR